MFSRRGHSLVNWTVIFSVLIAGLFFFRTTLKRTLASKIYGITDHYFWTRWGNETDQYKGDELTHSMSKVNQAQTLWQGERKDPTAQRSRLTETGELSSASEISAATSVEKGSEPLLKILEPEGVLEEVLP